MRIEPADHTKVVCCLSKEYLRQRSVSLSVFRDHRVKRESDRKIGIRQALTAEKVPVVSEEHSVPVPSAVLIRTEITEYLRVGQRVTYAVPFAQDLQLVQQLM